MSGGRALRAPYIVSVALASLIPTISVAQQQPTKPDWPQPVHNSPVLGYGILNQNEFRAGDGNSTYRWDGEGWYGNNLTRAWFKTEGDRNAGKSEEAEVQALYSRAITRYFDVQAGARYDFGAGPSQTWAAFGIQGLAPHYFDLGAHLFVSGSHTSIRVEGSRDLRITQRLILQPQAEINFYGHSDVRRGIGAGLSDVDAGLRFRYELKREIAPYIGLTHVSKYGRTAALARLAGEATHRLQFTAGVRLWFQALRAGSLSAALRSFKIPDRLRNVIDAARRWDEQQTALVRINALPQLRRISMIAWALFGEYRAFRRFSRNGAQDAAIPRLFAERLVRLGPAFVKLGQDPQHQT